MEFLLNPWLWIVYFSIALLLDWGTRSSDDYKTYSKSDQKLITISVLLTGPIIAVGVLIHMLTRKKK